MPAKPTLWQRALRAWARDDFAERPEPAIRMRRYDGADTGRRTGEWIADGGSADSEIGAGLAKMRERARDLCRNNPLARRIVDVMTTLTVGDGIVGSPNTGDPALDKRVLDLWTAWQAECDTERDFDFAGLQQLAFRSMLESGEVLCRFRPRFPEDGLTVPMQLQMIEPDLIDTSRNGLIDGATVRLGIRYDGLDRRSAYYLFRSHPGDTVRLDRAVSVVPASEVLHLFVKSRPGQSRGVTWLAPVMVAVRDLGDMQDAMLFREKLNACITNYIIRPDGWQPVDDEGNPIATDSEGRTQLTVEPGVSNVLLPGEDTKDAPTPGAESKYTEFVRESERFIASGTGVTYDQLTGDMTQANFSSLKAADRIQRRQVTALQWTLMIPRFCQPVWDRFIREAQLIGKLPSDRPFPVRWLPPAPEYIDKASEVEADILEMSAGGKTWSQWIQERGWDPDKQAEEIAADRLRLERAGVDLSQALAYMAGAKAAKAAETKPALKAVA